MNPHEVLALLAERAPALRTAAAGSRTHSWTFASNESGRDRATIRVGARWVCIEATLPRRAALDVRQLLQMQSALPGSIAALPRCGTVRLRAEFPLLAETAAARDWMSRQAVQACTGFSAHGRRNGDLPLGDTDQHIAFDAAALAERCSAAGWQASVRHTDEVRIELPLQTAHRIVAVNLQGAALRAAVTLGTGALAAQPAESHLAVATFLLRTTNSLRWVRAFATGSGERLEAVGYECILAQAQDDQPLILALDALATASELFGREAEELAENATLAHHYLTFDDGHASSPTTVAAAIA